MHHHHRHTITTTIAVFHSAMAFEQDISSWDVSSVTNMYEIFRNSPARVGVVLCGYHWHHIEPGTCCDIDANALTLSDVLCGCPPGTFCPENSLPDFVPTSCDTVGHYCPKGSMSSEPCPGGGHCPDTSTFIPCEAGVFSATTGSTDSSVCSQQCEVGGYCEVGSTSTTLCPAGTFQTELGQTSVAASFDFLHSCCLWLFSILSMVVWPPPPPCHHRHHTTTV